MHHAATSSQVTGSLFTSSSDDIKHKKPDGLLKLRHQQQQVSEVKVWWHHIKKDGTTWNGMHSQRSQISTYCCDNKSMWAVSSRHLGVKQMNTLNTRKGDDDILVQAQHACFSVDESDRGVGSQTSVMVSWLNILIPITAFDPEYWLIVSKLHSVDLCEES